MRRLILPFLLLSCLISCDDLNDGGNTFIKETQNNRQTKKAVLFERQAGATVPDSYQVTISNANSSFDKTTVGNTFTVDTHHGRARLDSNSINFTWLSDDSLEIDYDNNLRTFIMKKYVDGVVVVYKAR